MTSELRYFSVLIGFVVFIFIIDLVRRRRLREEYSWLWILAGLSICFLSFSYDAMIYVGTLFGGILPSTILYLFSILFLVLISLHYSVKISELHNQVKDLAQEVALLEERLKHPASDEE